MSRGGMCRNPIGVSTRWGVGDKAPKRLDKLDFVELMASLDPNGPKERGLFLQTITDAAHNYLYYGIGEEAEDGTPRGNGTCAYEFISDYRYFYKIRSYDQSTWGPSRVMEEVYFDEKQGRRVTRFIHLTRQMMEASCFDRHFELSGLDRFIAFDRFLAMLRQRRYDVLDENREQVHEYLSAVRRRRTGKSLPLQFGKPERLTDAEVQLLLEPDDEKKIIQFLRPRKRCSQRHVPRFNPALFQAACSAELTLAPVKGPIVDTEATVADPADDPRDRRAGLSN